MSHHNVCVCECMCECMCVCMYVCMLLASETLSGVTLLKIGDICLSMFGCTYVIFVL